MLPYFSYTDSDEESEIAYHDRDNDSEHLSSDEDTDEIDDIEDTVQECEIGSKCS